MPDSASKIPKQREYAAPELEPDPNAAVLSKRTCILTGVERERARAAATLMLNFQHEVEKVSVSKVQSNTLTFSGTQIEDDLGRRRALISTVSFWSPLKPRQIFSRSRIHVSFFFVVVVVCEIASR